MFVITLLICLLLGLFLSWRFTSRSYRQMTGIMCLLDSAAQGGELPELPASRYQDEYEILTDNLVKSFLEQRYKKLESSERTFHVKALELMALQAQINPHFLYNTLDSIAWMCERGKNADAVQMVHALARLFRISISRGHELIPIEKELQHAEAYLQIQKYRYKNQFTYHFTVDESCLHCLCNKITLQPIIENAIVHGLDLMVDSGHIEITVKPDGDDILLIVADDGIGMEPEQVAALLQNEPSDRTGIGVKNVNDRLRIYFGADYGISIESAPYEGTTVTIRTPRVPEDREGDYDKNH